MKLMNFLPNFREISGGFTRQSRSVPLLPIRLIHSNGDPLWDYNPFEHFISFKRVDFVKCDEKIAGSRCAKETFTLSSGNVRHSDGQMAAQMSPRCFITCDVIERRHATPPKWHRLIAIINVGMPVNYGCFGALLTDCLIDN